ncbi:MAG: sensor domain-containing diguanylate cyclase [Telluria sp.]
MGTAAARLFEQAIEQAWNPVVITSADASAGYPVERVNPAFCSMTGYRPDELLGRSLKLLQGAQTDREVLARLRACLRDQRYFEGTTVNYRKDGRPYVVRWNISPVRDADGRTTHFVSVQQDLTATVQAERRTRLLARALDASSDPILLTDAGRTILFANRAFGAVSGYQPDELAGRSADLLDSHSEGGSFGASLGQVLSAGTAARASFVHRRPDGGIVHTDQSMTPLADDDGQLRHVVSIGRDITEQVRREEGLREAAQRDSLTGLFNRAYGEQRLAAACSAAPGRAVVLMADADHFKAINDRFGHPAGDRVLRRLAELLRQGVRARDAVVRWGGEEFLLLLEDCPWEQALRLAETLRARVEADADAEAGRVTLSLGLARHRAQEAPAALLARADQALYEAKRGGRNRVACAPH